MGGELFARVADPSRPSVPPFGAPRVTLYREATAMTAWADAHGCPRVVISEHHGSADGYLPSPFVFGAAVAGRTDRIRIMISALVLSLRDPVTAAEDAAVLDVISNGRLELTVVPGYVRSEFALFGVPFDRRGEIFEQKLARFVDLLSRPSAADEGSTTPITPPPVQQPRPLIVVGGGAPKRAARFGDAFLPAVPDRQKAEIYRRECRAIGKGDGILLWPGGPIWVFVTDDPDRTWAQLGPHALHDANAYAAWAAGGEMPGGPFRPIQSLTELRASELFAVVTPEECLDFHRSLDPRAAFTLKPLIAGLDPDLGWRSLELFVDRVAPELR